MVLTNHTYSSSAISPAPTLFHTPKPVKYCMHSWPEAKLEPMTKPIKAPPIAMTCFMLTFLSSMNSASFVVIVYSV